MAVRQAGRRVASSQNSRPRGAMGDIDELNAHLGLVSEHLKSTAVEALTDLAPFLDRLQHRIFDLGGEVSIPGFQLIHDHHVDRIETELDQMNNELAPLENFIIPGVCAIAHAMWPGVFAEERREA